MCLSCRLLCVSLYHALDDYPLCFLYLARGFINLPPCFCNVFMSEEDLHAINICVTIVDELFWVSMVVENTCYSCALIGSSVCFLHVIRSGHSYITLQICGRYVCLLSIDVKDSFTSWTALSLVFGTNWTLLKDILICSGLVWELAWNWKSTNSQLNHEYKFSVNGVLERKYNSEDYKRYLTVCIFIDDAHPHLRDKIHRTVFNWQTRTFEEVWASCLFFLEC